MLIKDQHSLDSILEAIDKILQYSSGIQSGIDAEEVWQLICHKLPVLKENIRNLMV